MEKKIEHLVNWYFGNFCTRCARIDSEEENHGKDCHDKLNSLKNLYRIK